MSIGMVRWTPQKVMSAKDPAEAFAGYCEQVAGTPYPTATEMRVLRKKANLFFEQYPQCDWVTLCAVARWTVSRRRRFARVSQIVDQYRYAFEKGAIPELDARNAVDPHLESQITAALFDESDPVWRRRLLLAQSQVDRREVYSMWWNERSRLVRR